VAADPKLFSMADETVFPGLAATLAASLDQLERCQKVLISRSGKSDSLSAGTRHIDFRCVGQMQTSIALLRDELILRRTGSALTPQYKPACA
jgi:hypothetical protein